jgi:hypothetical protein
MKIGTVLLVITIRLYSKSLLAGIFTSHIYSVKKCLLSLADFPG